jgi:hypothetical protein
VFEAARQGASGLNKRAILTTYLLKKADMKSSSLLDRKRAKRQPTKHTDKKKDCFLEGRDDDDDGEDE